MRIAVDAMGGDYAPREIVKGAVRAVAERGSATRVILVGRENLVRDELKRCGGNTDRIEVRDAGEVVGMGESPALAVRRKKDSSIGRAVDLVKQGDADAIVRVGAPLNGFDPVFINTERTSSGSRRRVFDHRLA